MAFKSIKGNIDDKIIISIHFYYVLLDIFTGYYRSNEIIMGMRNDAAKALGIFTLVIIVIVSIVFMIPKEETPIIPAEVEVLDMGLEIVPEILTQPEKPTIKVVIDPTVMPDWLDQAFGICWELWSINNESSAKCEVIMGRFGNILDEQIRQKQLKSQSAIDRIIDDAYERLQ